MKTINENNAVASRNLATLESLFAFKGESIAKAGDVTVEESIKLGVALIARGEESKARGVFVLASKAAKLTAEESKTFRESLRSEMVLEAKTKAVALNSGAAPAALEKAKKAAEDEAVRRFDNMGQTLRAAQWMLANPRKVADGVSVYSVQQGLAYVNAPQIKEGAEGTADAETKLACHKAVAKLLAAPGTSQGQIKAAVLAAKAKVAKAHEVKDERTEAQKKAEGQTALVERLAGRVELIAKDIDGLASEGMKPDGWRSAKLTEAVKALAKLAGVELK